MKTAGCEQPFSCVAFVVYNNQKDIRLHEGGVQRMLAGSSGERMKTAGIDMYYGPAFLAMGIYQSIEAVALCRHVIF